MVLHIVEKRGRGVKSICKHVCSRFSTILSEGIIDAENRRHDCVKQGGPLGWGVGVGGLGLGR